jgi:hypothetical protein
LNLQKTASGRIAEVFAVRRFLFRFITRWSTSKNEENFLEKLKKDVRKWEKKFGKEEEIAAVTKKSTEKSTTAKETMAMATTAKNVTATANNTTATANNTTANNTVKAKTTVTANKTVTATANPNNKTTDAPAPRPIPRPTYRQPTNPPTPGPSRNRKFNELSHDSGEEPLVQNPASESDNRNPSPPPKKRIKVQHQHYSNSQKAPSYEQYVRRPPMPTGILFDVPCNRCIRRGKECEKDAHSASCVLCYRMKNRCDYGKRYRGKPKNTFKAKGKGKGKERVREEKYDPESEDMTDGETHPRKRATKKMKSSQFIDTDDDMTSEYDRSGYQTACPPPTSRSPSPSCRPIRAAARKAKRGVAAMIAVDMASTVEASQPSEEVDGMFHLLPL